MAKLSRDEIRSHAAAAGFKGEDLNTAVAVAFAESGGDPRSHNPVPPDDSYGLWQINMLGSMGPARRKQYNLSSNTDLYDPATNARVAYGIFKGSGWKAWTTYTRGTYKKFLTGSPGDTSTSVESPGESTSKDPVVGISGAINAFGATIFKGIAGMVGMLVALALLIIGIVILARKQATQVLPMGKVAKAVLK